jgi:hypothetical protein
MAPEKYHAAMLRLPVLLVAGLLILPASGPAGTAPDEPTDPRVVALREAAHPLRSIDPADEDFSDLAPAPGLKPGSKSPSAAPAANPIRIRIRVAMQRPTKR